MSIKTTSPYIPSFLKAALSDSRPLQLTFSDLADTNIKSTSSFKYDSLDSPIKSTQQLNIDWSKFENHTFFSSAEVKVNTAFDQIINGYPFDGTKAEFEKFFENLTGFEKWVFDQFPKFGGQLHFSGTQIGEDPSNGFSDNLGTWIEVKDVAGWLYPDLSKNKSGESLLNPNPEKSFTIEMQLFLPDQSNDTQVVLQKATEDKTQGYTFYINPSTTSLATGTFSIMSGGVHNSITTTFDKGKFNHLCISLNREDGLNILEFFVNEKLKNTSKKDNAIDAFTEKPSLYIGSGSSFYQGGALVSPLQTLSGTLDELRIFHSYRTIKQQQAYSSKGIFSNDSLRLYYRFNEPSGQLSTNPNDQTNSLVLDSSGNSLHAHISNFDSSLRQNTAEDPLSPLTNERKEFKVILFPLFSKVISLNNELLASASIYDEANPNLITKLVPRHYLREGALNDGFANTQVGGSIGNSYSENSQGAPGQGKLGSVQIIMTFLYIWAKFFDEIKLFVESFGTLRTVDYETNNTIPDNFLMDYVRYFGFYLPPFFNSSNVSQYVEGEDINGISVADLSLKNVQAQILRRVLINLPDVMRSKGTQHSIRSFLRSVGIDPDNSVRIREFGGPTAKQLGSTREARTDVVPVVDFITSSLITTQFLSASRVEPGIPEAVGPFVNGISSYSNDGLLTSGSWTFEGLYRYGPKNLNRSTASNQSLMRLEVTGSLTTAQTGLLANLVTSGSSTGGSLRAFVRPGMSATSPYLELVLDNVNILDGNWWNVSLGCTRSDQVDSIVSSSYFLRAAKQNGGEITNIYTTSSYFYEQPSLEGNAFRQLSSTLNASGSRLSIGNDPNIPEGSIGYVYLNDNSVVPDIARASDFVGQASNIRFWSKSIKENEWKEHVRNYKSVGVENALVNYNYVTNVSGSWEKLRLSTLEKQETKFADSAAKIIFLDMSENNHHAAGTGFGIAQRVYFGELFSYSYISPYYDEYSTIEKIRPRGFIDEEYLKDAPWAELAPVHELKPEQAPMDDPRLSIEFSLIDTLNKDIITMFANLDVIGNAIGSPELLFSPHYPDLERLREIYFTRIKDKINFRGFFEFYKWFDTSISTFIQQLVPRKTRFKGTNFVIESHMLERHKMEYHSSEIYLGDATRNRIRDLLLVQQITGKFTRY